VIEDWLGHDTPFEYEYEYRWAEYEYEEDKARTLGITGGEERTLTSSWTAPSPPVHPIVHRWFRIAGRTIITVAGQVEVSN
jgi:hypothetical protein